jgi:vacuolar-type H+-ATPase subunit I/STV1
MFAGELQGKGVGCMKNIWMLWRIAVFSLVAFLGSIPCAHSQDVLRDLNQVKSELSDLRNEVSQLRTLVYSLREAVLKSVTSHDQETVKKTPPKESQPAPMKKQKPVDEKEITRSACQAVGKFFTEVDASLRASDEKVAEARMREALRHMNSALSDYAHTHRVSKLLNIYEGLAWDTYVAVELRQSIQGNQGFLDALKRHKKKYRETCPGK